MGTKTLLMDSPNMLFYFTSNLFVYFLRFGIRLLMVFERFLTFFNPLGEGTTRAIDIYWRRSGKS